MRFRFTSFISRAESLFASVRKTQLVKRIFRRLDYETEERKALGIHTPPVKQTQKFVLASVAALVLCFFVYEVSYYAHWQKSIEEDPKVWNLSKDKISWDVFYGQSAQCGDIPCQFNPGHTKVTKRMVLPAREFPLVGWKKGEKVYLSTVLTIPERIQNTEEALVLYSIYLWAKNYKFYLNSKLFHSGGLETLFVTIPRELVGKTIHIGFEIDPGDLPYQGLANKEDLLMGPKTLLMRSAFSSYEYLTTYQLWFLLPKLILLIFFVSLYAGFYRFKEVFHLIVFLIFSALNNYVRSAYYPLGMDSVFSGRVIDQVIFAFSQIALLTFVHEYFRRYSLFFNVTVRTISIFLGISIILFYASPDIQTLLLHTNFFTKIGRVLYYAAFIYGALLSALTSLYLKGKGVNGFRTASAAVLYTIFTAITGTLFILEVMPTAQVIDIYFFHNITSLLLIFSLASVILVEFGIALPQRNAIKGLFAKFINQKILRDALKSEDALQPRKRNIVTLVVDIRGFSAYCETHQPEEVVMTLNSIRKIIGDAANAFSGLVDKYTGDGALLLFGVLDSKRNDRMDALQTGVLILSEFNRQFKHLRSSNGDALQLGIGISSGEAIVGAIGSEERVEYTALGHSVNRAFRLEELTKTLGIPLLVDAETFAAIADRTIVAVFPDQKMKGMEIRSSVYGILGYCGPEDEWICVKPEYQAIIGQFETPTALTPQELILLRFGFKAA